MHIVTWYEKVRLSLQRADMRAANTLNEYSLDSRDGVFQVSITIAFLPKAIAFGGPAQSAQGLNAVLRQLVKWSVIHWQPLAAHGRAKSGTTGFICLT